VKHGGPAAVLVGGHLVDEPDRPNTRFPQWRVGWVAAQIRKVFDDWAVGPATTVICGGARGADIIAAEEALSLGAHVVLCLALPLEAFEKESVALPGTDWLSRFRDIMLKVEIRHLDADSARPGNLFVLANQWMIELARSLDRDPCFLFVWDGQAGAAGGTADLVRQLGYQPAEARIRFVDPTPG
jgi:hypothetical protein